MPLTTSRRLTVAVLVAAALVAACGPPAGTVFRTTLNTPDGSSPMPVTLGDTTDLVVSLEPGVGGAFVANEPSVTADPAHPNVLIVQWMGGACEDETVVGFWPDGEAYGMYVSTRGGPGLFGGCPGIGIPRAIRITLTSPIAAELVRFSTSA